MLESHIKLRDIPESKTLLDILNNCNFTIKKSEERNNYGWLRLIQTQILPLN